MRKSSKRYDLDELIEVFKILANKNRLDILHYLERKRQASVGVMADNINASFKATSKHLLSLTRRGILKRRYDGPFVVYRISENLSPSIRLIINYLI